MPPYDDRFFAPPAAVLNARLRNPQNGAIIPDTLLLIDTGADVTLLPLAAVNAAGIEQTGHSCWMGRGRRGVNTRPIEPNRDEGTPVRRSQQYRVVRAQWKLLS